MAGTFKFELVSPERILMSAEASEVLVPGAEGDFTVFVEHAPVISTLRPGVVEAKMADGKVTRLYVHGGFCEVTPHSLTVLAEKAHDVAAMDAASIAGHLKDAEAALASAAANDDDARHAANTAIARLKALS